MSASQQYYVVSLTRYTSSSQSDWLLLRQARGSSRATVVLDAHRSSLLGFAKISQLHLTLGD